MVAALERLADEGLAGGLAHGVAVWAGGRAGTELAWGRGLAAVAPAPAPLTLDLRWDCASLTKVVVTAPLAALCHQWGLLDLGAPARTYLPELPDPPGAALTVRHLATYTAGALTTPCTPGAAPADLWRLWLGAPFEEPPGRTFRYACRDLILLGLIVERRTGRRLDDLAREHLWRPLGMDGAAFGPLATDLARVVPTDHPPGVVSDPKARAADRPLGNAGLFATGADLARYCRALLAAGRLDGHRALAPATVAEMLRVQTPPGLPPVALVWDARPAGDAPHGSPHRPASLSPEARGHSGWPGHSLWLDPGHDFFLVVLSNRTHPVARDANYLPSMRWRAALGDAAFAALRGAGR